MAKVMDFYEVDENGEMHCKLCPWSTVHLNRARRHVQVRHATELDPEPVMVKVRGVPVETAVVVADEKAVVYQKKK